MDDAARDSGIDSTGSGGVPPANSLIAAALRLVPSLSAEAAPAAYSRVRVFSSEAEADILDAETVEKQEEDDDDEDEADAANDENCSWWQRLTAGRAVCCLLLSLLTLLTAAFVLETQRSAAQRDVSASAVVGNEESKTRYLLFHPGFAGFGNQLAALQRAVTLANIAKRVLVLPPLLSGHLQYALYSSWVGRSLANATRTIRFDLQLVQQYEQSLPLFTFNASALSSQRVVLLSEYVLRFGPDAPCWIWPQGVGNLSARLLQQEQEQSVCVGPTGFRFNNVSRTPLRRFWIADSAVTREAEQWLHSSPLRSSRFVCLHYRAGDFSTAKPDVFTNLSAVVAFTQTAMREANYSQHSLFLMTDSAFSADRLLVAQQAWSQLEDAALPMQQSDSLMREMRRIALEQRICSLSSLFIGCGPSTFSQMAADLLGCGSWTTQRCRSYCPVREEDWKLTE